MEISTKNGNSATRISPAGELDVASAPAFQDAWREAASASESVVIDLRGVTFIDSEGVRALLRARAESKARGLRLALVQGSSQVHRVLELTGLVDRFRFVSAS